MQEKLLMSKSVMSLDIQTAALLEKIHIFNTKTSGQQESQGRLISFTKYIMCAKVDNNDRKQQGQSRDSTRCDSSTSSEDARSEE